MLSRLPDAIFTYSNLWNLMPSFMITRNAVRERIVPEMAGKFCSTGVRTHDLKQNKRVPVIVILNLLYPALVNGKMFDVKAHTKRVVQVATADCN